MEFPELEQYFQELTDITDGIAVMNTPYDGDFDGQIQEMRDFFADVSAREWEAAEAEYFKLFASHFTFHVKIVEEVINEAREILDPERKPQVKQLVQYVKEANDWFQELEKRRKQRVKGDMAHV